MSATSGIGMPATLFLEQFGRIVREAFCGDDLLRGGVYHVGSSMQSSTYRDVDVRLILSDEAYALFIGGDPEHQHTNGVWVGHTMAYSLLGKHMTGLPIDFQIQQQSDANKKYSTKDGHRRSSLGVRSEMFTFEAGVAHD